MIVCICKGVNDRKLREEIRNGNRTLREIRSCCGAGTDCGACTRQIRDLLATEVATRAAKT